MDAINQLGLFTDNELNPTYGIKRQIRLALSNTSLSRDQVVDRMNEIARREGLRKTVSKATLDSWCKDSEPDRLPAPPWLTILCHVLGTTDPIGPILKALGWGLVNEQWGGKCWSGQRRSSLRSGRQGRQRRFSSCWRKGDGQQQL